jgi:hypothetical protein
MNLEDRAAVAWMAGFSRNPWPKSIVWRQDDVTHDRFYWLGIPMAGTAKAGQVVRARVEGQVIEIQSDDVRNLVLWLSDRLLDLDQPVTVKANGKLVHEGLVRRHLGAIRNSLDARPDPAMIPTALLEIAW